jgi:membrane protease YdiL (CAAX protease family)
MTQMHRILRDPTGAVRAVWKLAAFVGLAVVALGLAGPVAGIAGLFLGGGAGNAVYAGAASGLLLVATWLCLRLEGGSLRDLGLAFRRRRVASCAVGFAIGAALFAIIALAQGAMVGAVWGVHPRAGIGAAASGLAVALAFLLPEELVFRGYAFCQLARIAGRTGALVLSAAAFGAYHVLGSGDWAMGAFFRFAMPMLGGLVFGYALLRSGDLALPIGLHWGGNWAQASLFGVDNAAGPPSLWTTTLTPAEQRALTAPDLLPHLPYLLGLAAVVVVLRRWPVHDLPYRCSGPLQGAVRAGGST